MSPTEIILLVVAAALALVLLWFLVVRGAIDLFYGISENFGIPIIARLVYVVSWIFLMPLMLIISLYLSILIFFESDEQKRQKREARATRRTAS
jgi:phage shock protein PspC (stress-responsive transcriptional regulator)